MKKHLIRLLALVLVILTVFGITACTADTPEFLDDGASRFSANKDEEDYTMENSGVLLDDLIKDFSGSYQLPTGTQMDDDDYDKAKKKADEEKKTASSTPSGTTDPSGSSSGGTSSDSSVQKIGDVYQVGDFDDLKAAFHQAYASTSKYLEFDLVNNYTIDLAVDFQEVFTALQREDPIWVCCVEMWSTGTRGNRYLVEITYTMPRDTLIEIKKATAGLVDEAVKKIQTEGKTAYEIVYQVNEYLCNVAYYPPKEPYAAITHTAYGALHDGVAVCEGYACAVKLMLDRFEIPCDIQVGVCTNGGGHAWNLVKLDGEWYQLDTTWNDQSTNRLDYFLVTDQYMRKSRSWDEPKYPKSATKPYKP